MNTNTSKLTHNGKSWDEMTNREKHALWIDNEEHARAMFKQSDPEGYETAVDAASKSRRNWGGGR